ncbi:MAG: hypothetical protein K2K60_01240 [Clostridia bacterium]|nr:hypothetical protein [Clostridia bacterium]
MTVLIIVFTLLLIGAVAFRVAAGVYDKIPFFAAISTPLTWICVIIAAAWLVFIGIKVYNEIKKK